MRRFSLNLVIGLVLLLAAFGAVSPGRPGAVNRGRSSSRVSRTDSDLHASALAPEEDLHEAAASESGQRVRKPFSAAIDTTAPMAPPALDALFVIPVPPLQDPAAPGTRRSSGRAPPNS
jgi:hypothetical protein